jgi:hypothetical protein
VPQPPNRRPRRLWPAVTAIVVLGLVAACSGSSSAPAGSSVASPGVVPSTLASQVAPSTAPGGAGVALSEPTHGLAVTLPAGWIGMSQADAKNAANVAALKATSAVQAKLVDDLVAALGQHSEYWFAAGSGADHAVLTAQIRLSPDFAGWSTQQEAALKQAYGDVQTTALSTPREGVSFKFKTDTFASEMFGFKRPGGVTLFTFLAPGATTAPNSWEAAIASFTDAGT